MQELLQRGHRRFIIATALTASLLALPSAVSALESGDRAPEFSAPSLEGDGSLSLSRYRGKVVFLDFWASWCGPCLISLPKLEELRKEFPADRFQILAVNVDSEPDKAKAFLERRPVGYPSAFDPKGSVPASFEIETMPTSFLIDEKGVIRYVHSGFRPGDVSELRDRIGALVGGKK